MLVITFTFFSHFSKVITATLKRISATTKVILISEEVITTTLKVILATRKVILTTEEVITIT